MATFIGAVQRLWSKTKTLPPVLTGPVRALLGEARRGKGDVQEASGRETGTREVRLKKLLFHVEEKYKHLCFYGHIITWSCGGLTELHWRFLFSSSKTWERKLVHWDVRGGSPRWG